jgi:transposase
MGLKIEVARLELSAAQLRRLASRSVDGRLACRILAIALVLEGTSRGEAASACGMDRQTLRDWVHRYNHEGIDGLSDARRSGRPAALSAEQMEDLKALVLAGPDLAIHGVTRWRCVDLCAVIADRHGVVVHERTVGKMLRRMGLTRLQPRPYHPKKDGAAQEAFKKRLFADSSGQSRGVIVGLMPVDIEFLVARAGREIWHALPWVSDRSRSGDWWKRTSTRAFGRGRRFARLKSILAR